MESSDPNNENIPQLSAIELRVLGALMEKQLTTPDAYPLTVNSIITACNQKSSREPVSNYHQGDVKRTLQALESRKFVQQEYGSRAEKYSQRFIKHLELGKKQQALLCVMMLRGPQTVSELDTRTQRMCDFNNRDDLQHCIDRLCDREIPYAIRLGQQPGQRGERIAHLFSGTPTVGVSSKPATTAVAPSALPSEDDDNIILLQLELDDLKTTVHELKNESAELKQHLNELYRLTGHKEPE